MRKLTKIISLVIIIAMVLQNTVALANVIEIGEKSLIKEVILAFILFNIGMRQKKDGCILHIQEHIIKIRMETIELPIV